MISDTLILMIFIAIWLVFFVLGWAFKNRFLLSIAGVIGMILGIRMIGDVDRLLGLAVVITSLYPLYLAAFSEEKK